MISRKQAIKQLFLPGSSRPEHQNHDAVVQATGATERSVTYREFESIAAQCAQELRDAGARKGDRIVICSENSPEMAALVVACWGLNLVAVPVDLRITQAELANVVRMLEAKVLVGSSNIMPEFKAKANAASKELATIDLKELASHRDERTDHEPWISLEEVDGSLPAFIILTSGTTGRPKGAVHSLDSFLINLQELAEMAGIESGMRGVLPLPLSHIFGLEVFYIALIFGMTVVFSELTPASFVACVSKHKPHVIAGVPTLYGALLAAPREALDLSGSILLLSGGAPLATSLAQDFEAKFGKRINNGYGSTESKLVALNQTGPIDAVGKIVPSVKIEIVNDKDEVLGQEQVGEIRISGPILMSGYLGMSDETKKVLRDGHYYTSDMGYFKNGDLYISGRSKEMIIVAGYKVFPVEVEDALRKHPLVKEVAILGQPHRQLGQIVKAVVVVNDGELSEKLERQADERKQARQEILAQLKEYCKDNLRRELRPMEWELQPASSPLPKTATGKVDKKQLEPAPV